MPRAMRAMNGERFSLLPKKIFFHLWSTYYGLGGGKMIFFGSSENRSPSIARMARGIGTSVYSSPKAFPSLQSDNSNVLSALAASAAPPGGN